MSIKTVLPFDIVRYINSYVNKPLNDIMLKKAVELWFKDKAKCIKIYNHISLWNVTKCTDMYSLFEDKTEFNEDISNWNVRNLTNMQRMFYNCREFNCNLSRWNVSNVTNMTGMFCNCQYFNCNLSTWNVSNVTDMRGMFCFAINFNSDISNWNVNKLTDSDYIFLGCDSLKFNTKKWGSKLSEKSCYKIPKELTIGYIVIITSIVAAVYISSAQENYF